MMADQMDEAGPCEAFSQLGDVASFSSRQWLCSRAAGRTFYQVPIAKWRGHHRCLLHASNVRSILYPVTEISLLRRGFNF